MRIEVTAEDIAAANEWLEERDARIAKAGLHSRVHLDPEGQNSYNCPIARAARRAFGDRFRNIGAILVLDGGPHLYVPYDVQERMIEWDTGEGMEPFSFEVDDA